MKREVQDLKDFIREQEILTRRLIVKNSRKNDYNNIKKQLAEYIKKDKKERSIRSKYPACREAYKHYKLTLALAGKK
tara:strand:+ start:66 stop:296 length:231 start_codon:yes stop_codon:yes gene_type:complete